jgi:excisionase family DNA binding protein
MTEELLTCEELAERLRLRPSTVRASARTGRIPAVRVGPKVIRFDYQQVGQVLQSASPGGGDRTTRRSPRLVDIVGFYFFLCLRAHPHGGLARCRDPPVLGHGKPQKKVTPPEPLRKSDGE